MSKQNCGNGLKITSIFPTIWYSLKQDQQKYFQNISLLCNIILLLNIMLDVIFWVVEHLHVSFCFFILPIALPCCFIHTERVRIYSVQDLFLSTVVFSPFSYCICLATLLNTTLVTDVYKFTINNLIHKKSLVFCFFLSILLITWEFHALYLDHIYSLPYLTAPRFSPTSIFTLVCVLDIF